MFTRSHRKLDRHATISMAALALLIAGLLSPLGLGVASSQTVVFSADAYGSFAFVGTTVILGRTAPLGLGCDTNTAISKSATVVSVNLPPIATTGAINTTLATTTSSSEGTADVVNEGLLGGVITADEIKAVSTTTLDANGLSVSASGSGFINLVVNGSAVSSNVPPNTTIKLAGIGKVVLNEQSAATGSWSAKLIVNMIHVYVTQSNPLGIATGTQIILPNASSGLTLLSAVNGPAVLGGVAYGTQVTGSLITSSPTAAEFQKCFGTNGVTISNSLASVNIPLVLTSGTVADTAEGNITQSQAEGHTTSTVQSLNLLAGLVTVGALTVQANASTTDGTHVTRSDTGTSFTNLIVAGHPEIIDSVPPNTTVSLLGIGTLYLRRELTSSNAIVVRGIQLVIAKNNVLGLPTGTNIIVGSASASVHTN